MHFATALEHDVVIEIRPRAKAAKKGRILIVGAAPEGIQERRFSSARSLQIHGGQMGISLNEAVDQ